MGKIKNIFEKILDFFEDYCDKREIDKMIKKGDLEKGEDYEKIAKELGI